MGGKGSGRRRVLRTKAGVPIRYSDRRKRSVEWYDKKYGMDVGYRSAKKAGWFKKRKIGEFDV